MSAAISRAVAAPMALLGPGDEGGSVREFRCGSSGRAAKGGSRAGRVPGPAAPGAGSGAGAGGWLVLGVVVCEVAGEFAVGVGLVLECLGTGVEKPDGVRPGGEAQRWLL